MLQILLFLFIIAFAAFFASYLDNSLGMGYGTLLVPVLLVSGMSPMMILPAVMGSQAIASVTGAIRHHLHNYMSLSPSTSEGKTTFFIVFLGGIGATMGAFFALNIPETLLEAFIGVLITAMGVILLSQVSFYFSPGKVLAVGTFGAFSKAATGTGFGPIIVAGHIMAGYDSKKTVGITTAVRIPVCFITFIVYLIAGARIDWYLLSALLIGAVPGSVAGSDWLGREHDIETRRLAGMGTVIMGALVLLGLVL